MKKVLLVLIIGFILSYVAFAKLNVYFVDVGQGDAIVINADDHWAIIDGGDTGTSSKLYSYINNHLNVNYFDLVVLTHPDKDHVGGLSGAIKGRITKKTTVWCNCDSDDRYFTSFKSYIETSGCELQNPYIEDSIVLGKATFTVLGPLNEMDNKNDNSLIVRLDYNGKSFLFMGDASWSAENQLTNKYATANEFGTGFNSPMLDVDILKVGHHGSSESSSILFLECTTPDIVIISVGEGNRYGHPKTDTLSRFIQMESDIYRTDNHGNINVSVSDSGVLTVNTQFNNNKPWFDENLLSTWQKKQRGLI